MPSTHTSLHYHVVFSTKNREPWFTDPAFLTDSLLPYLGGIIRQMGGESHINGGVADHVHLLFGLKPTHCLSDVMRELKAVSSGWITEKLGRSAFAWQEGYGAFTVGATELKRVHEYVRNQAEHHHNKSFQDEYIEMLKRGLVEYDDRYLW